MLVTTEITLLTHWRAYSGDVFFSVENSHMRLGFKATNIYDITLLLLF